MKHKIIRIGSWFSTIFYALLSFVCLMIFVVENFDLYNLVTCLIFLVMAMTGLFARNFGLNTFKFYKFMKPIAILSLIFAILLVIVAPIIFVNYFGVGESFDAIVALLIMFIPAGISSLAILSYKVKENDQRILEKYL